MLSASKLQSYKEFLEKEKVRLEKEIEKDEKPQDFGNDIDHFDEEADEAEEFSNRLAVAHALKEDLDEIKQALANFAAGTYGVCKGCGAEIEEKVLDIAPESQLCRTCKKKAQ